MVKFSAQLFGLVGMVGFWFSRFGLVDGVGFGCLEPPVSPAGHLLLPGVLLSFQQGGLTTKHTLNIVFGLTIKIAVYP
jgi:hypothetical protein